MGVDVKKLLSLPAADRLELAEILRRSVGYPADIEILPLPDWQRAQMDGLLERYASRAND